MILDSGKTRDLNGINQKIVKDSDIIQSTLSALLSKANGSNMKVLEVGFGYGRALLELAWQFRQENISFLGINKKKQTPMGNIGDLIGIAREYDIIPEENMDEFNLPEIFFYDASSLHFEDASVDLIYSAVTIRFIDRKAEFLEEVCRVLKPGGVALLQIGEANWDYPYSRICDQTMLTPYFNRFVLKHKDELIPLPTYLKHFEEDAFQFKFLPQRRCTLTVNKLKSSRLDLQLTSDPELSVPMENFSYKHFWKKKEGRRGGFRCVYNLRPEIYQALFQAGLLSHDQLKTDVVIPENA
ncbi:MAG: class I SAM-dependent methyltransferase [Nitrospiria bacterium]